MYILMVDHAKFGQEHRGRDYIGPFQTRKDAEAHVKQWGPAAADVIFMISVRDHIKYQKGRLA